MKETKKKVNKLTAAAFMVGAGLARVAATTLEIAEAVMESYDPEAALKSPGTRRRQQGIRGFFPSKSRRKSRGTKITPGPGAVCESKDDSSSERETGSSSDDDSSSDAFNATRHTRTRRKWRAAMTAPELLRRKGATRFGRSPRDRRRLPTCTRSG